MENVIDTFKTIGVGLVVVTGIIGLPILAVSHPYFGIPTFVLFLSYVIGGSVRGIF